MDPITQFLTTLGPWGILAAGILGLLVPKAGDLLRRRFGGNTPTARLLDALRDLYRKTNPAADPDAKVAELLTREMQYCGYRLANPQPPDVPTDAVVDQPSAEAK